MDGIGGIVQMQQVNWRILKEANTSNQIIITGDSGIEIELNSGTLSVPGNSMAFLYHKDYVSKFCNNSEEVYFIWFNLASLVIRPELFFYVKYSYYFKNPRGVIISNDKISIEHLKQNYQSCFSISNVPSILKRVVFLNTIENIFAQLILSENNSKEVSEGLATHIITNTEFPNSISTIEQINNYNVKLSNRFINLLKTEKELCFSVEYYAEKLNITKRSLDKATLEVFGCTAKAIITEQILSRAKDLLKYTSEPIKNISFDLGFSQESNFNIFFKKKTGLSPIHFRKHNIKTIEN